MSERIFLGIGAGPIQTGIYVAGAAKGGFDRIVLADVDTALVSAIRQSGSITVNTALSDRVVTDTYKNIEIYNPGVPEDLEILKDIASRALAVNTALPATRFYQFCAGYLREGFARAPERERYVYTSENSTTAAKELREAVGVDFPKTWYLDTVIGKMSKIFASGEADLPTLAPAYGKGHLVEAFNTIYSSSAPGIEQVGLVGLYPKADLVPFEEAKLYGHNASHFLLGILAYGKNCTYMSDAVKYPELVKCCEDALIEECGPALCRKYAGVDEYFTPAGYNAWAVELVKRMTNPELRDSVDRVIRDLDRKLSWNDRLIGAIRLCRSQQVEPKRLMQCAQKAAALHGLRLLSSGSWPEGEENAALLEALTRD